MNLEYLESKLESVDGEEVQRVQDNINSLFHHCVQALGEEHQIKVVNALQVNNNREYSSKNQQLLYLKPVEVTTMILSDSWLLISACIILKLL